jgi:uncharacterized protein YeaO (DUF488 family)
VPKRDLALRNFYDVWVPGVAPSDALLRRTKQPGHTAAAWNTFARAYRREMKQPDASRLLDLLAALSHVTDLSVGCYCADEQRCHRSLLRTLLDERGARLV